MGNKKSVVAVLFGVVILLISGVILFVKFDFFESDVINSKEKTVINIKEDKETIDKQTTELNKKEIKQNKDVVTVKENKSIDNKKSNETSENEPIKSKEVVAVNKNEEINDKEVPIENIASEKVKNIIGHNIGTKVGNYNTDNTNPPPILNQAKTEGQKYKLPVTPQLQQVWYYCAPTTVSMMLSARGIDVDQFQLAKEMGTYEPYGTHNADAIRILNKYMFGTEQPTSTTGGYQLETVTQVDEATLTTFKQRVMKNIQDGYPMYYTFDVSKIYPGLEGEHNVVGNGYVATPDGNDVAYIYYIDPSPNVQDSVYGSLKIVTPEELLNAMISCGEPNYAW